MKKRFFYNLARFSQKKNRRPLQQFDPDCTDYKKILVLSTTAIGDTLLSTPVFKALRQEFPQATIKVLMQKKFIPLFATNPHVDGLIPFKKGIVNFFNIVQAIKKDEFDIALVLHISDPFPVFMAVSAKIPFLVGYPPDEASAHFFSYSVPPPIGKHVIYHRLAVLEAVKPHHSTWSERLILPLEKGERGKITAKYEQLGLSDCEKLTLIGFQPGASKEFKMWPLESFVELGTELIKQDDKNIIVILGSQAEKKLGEKIIKGIGRENRVLSLCGDIPIGELPLMVSSLQSLVTNDTGTMHIAIALKIPTVSLFVPTSHRGIGPIQDNEIHSVVSRPRPCGDQCVTKKCTETPSCMSLLPVNEVLDATLRSLEK